MKSEVKPAQSPPGPGLWVRAVEGDGAALETLAGQFWYAAYVWLRVAGNNAADTAMHTISFFARLQTMDKPRPDESCAGRFRDFILDRLKNFARQSYPSSDGFPTFLLDVSEAERRYANEPSRGEDELFARRWSLTVLENTLLTLQAEHDEQGKSELFTALKPFLEFSKGNEGGYGQAAEAIGMSTSAFHMAAYHFRIRYREIIRHIVRDTVRAPEDVDSELTVLLVGAS